MSASRRAFRAALAVALLGATALHVPSAAAAAPAEAALPEVPGVDVPVTIDGFLDEPMWEGALVFELDVEVGPGDNVPPPVRTVVLLTYDAERILVGFRSFDPDPGAIRARYRDRDNIWEDDFVGVAFDTFNDARSAYEFIANPLGVQIDAINDQVAGDYDTSWDAVWTSAGRITSEGYVVEMAIPFRQLRFQPTEDPQVWGFDAVRFYPRTDRHHIRASPRPRGVNNSLSQIHKVRGFGAVQSGRNLEVVPTITGARNDVRNDAGELEGGSGETDLGVSARWGVTPNWFVSGTLNPDFSQIEADALKLDVNEQFTLFFPETRPFFLDGADTFDTQLDLVYTRTVSDPSSALKLTGKQGQHTVGAFSARDDVTNVLIPGSERSRTGTFEGSVTSTVARYRYDLGGSSTVGVLLTDREGSGYSNRVGSVDLRWKPTDHDTLSVQGANSTTRYSDEMTAAFGLEGDGADGHALEASYRRSMPRWGAEVELKDLDDEFRADLGFIRRVDLRGYQVSGWRTWEGEADDVYNRLTASTWAYRNEQQSGELLEEGVGINGSGRFAYETEVNVHVVDETRRFGGRDFDLLRGNFSARSRPSGALGFGVSGDWGDWIDFSGARPADRRSLRLSTSVSLGQRFDSRWIWNYSTLDLDEGRLFTARAPELRLLYYFDDRLRFRLIGQYTTVDRDPVLSAGATRARTEDLLTQLLAVYEVGPQTALYVGYGDTWDNEGAAAATAGGVLVPQELQRTSRSFFVKFGYAWQP